MSESLDDDCLALIFNLITNTNDRNNSSLVSRRWLGIEARTRTHLSLNAQSDLQPFIPSIFTRFNSLTQLVLHNNDSTSVVGINDNDMILISSMCPNLSCLKLRECRQLTDSGLALFSRNCNNLKEFSCVRCSFSDSGMFELLDNCGQLEVLCVERLRAAVGAPANFRAGLAANTLKVIELRSLCNERLFEPLIIGSPNLNILKLICCDGIWDRSLEMIRDDNCLAEVHLSMCKVTDVGISSLSKCRDLNVLLIIPPNKQCTDVGLISVAENCKGLKKLHVMNSVRSNIGDKGLIAVGKHCVKLEDLALNRVNATCVSLHIITTNCHNLVTLAFCSCWTITDAEMMCIAEKCVALRTLIIDQCDVSNKGIEAFALGCPNLVKIEVTQCKKVSREVKDWLIARRGSLVVKLNVWREYNC